ncbi:gluconate 2-dehydrogenase subunit 3 family protein [uncultured Paraglaciecola sp.]|uniref:gluconate 2-dehydrogenase subunit 3 family protein n=1 Tax=uncultured Paraglaciecola sp. TaxID=1765024 RepID=UPI0030DD6D78|tara:strand:+ start:136533 stop:137144 length:612 start_codon:yes stop_codon:yes gene_type:complete
MMDRRDLIKMIMATTGAAMVGGNAIGYEMKSQVPLSKTIFKSDDVILFNEVAEVILPRTSTPGAKDANVGLMALILANDCYTLRERDSLVQGLQSLNEQANKVYGSPYLLLSSQQKTEFVSQLDVDAKAYNNKQKIYYLPVTPYNRNSSDDKPLPHYFTLIKQLTLFSFFTSKVGATEVLRYEAVPGKYNGELPYKKGDRAWF